MASTWTCPEGASVTDSQLIDIAVLKLVAESQSPNQPPRIRYRSVPDFLQRNPGCCEVRHARGASAVDLPIPLFEPVEMTISYRHSEAGDRPFRIRHILVGPCPPDMEESEQLVDSLS